MQEQGANPLPAQHPNRPGANPPFTVANTIFICGIDSPTLNQGDSQADHIDSEVFDDDFVSCMDKKIKELDNNLKSYSNSQIRLNPGQKKMLKHLSSGQGTSTT